MYFVLTQRGGKYRKRMVLQCFSVHMTYVCPFIFTIMAYDSPPYYSNCDMMISFLAYKNFKSQYLFHT